MWTTYIYGIWDLEITKFIYVGKSNEPCDRFKGHMEHSGNDCVRKFVEEKGIDNFGLIILERTNFFGVRDWVKREKFWIKKFREEGHPLCNRNGGGGGVTEHTEETKVRMSKSKTGENHPMYGEHLSKETKTKISQTNEGNESGAKSYPAFYNVKTKEFIHSGCNLAKMCRNRDLSEGVFRNLNSGLTKQTYEGWRLAAEVEIHSERVISTAALQSLGC